MSTLLLIASTSALSWIPQSTRSTGAPAAVWRSGAAACMGLGDGPKLDGAQNGDDLRLAASLVARIAGMRPEGETKPLGPDDVTAISMGPHDVVSTVFAAFSGAAGLDGYGHGMACLGRARARRWIWWGGEHMASAALAPQMKLV